MHDTRRKRKKNPMRAAYRNLKDHAKARKSDFWPNGIPFRLTFPSFRYFALRSDYLNRTGNGGHCLTVDRIDATKGYVKGNLQPLTRIANSIKKAKIDAIRMKAGFSWVEKHETNGQN